MKFVYIERHTVYQLFDEYIKYFYVCYDEFTGREIIRIPMQPGKTGKTLEIILESWDETKCIN